jgi:hypothetical protein
MEKVVSILLATLFTAQSVFAMTCKFYGEKAAGNGRAPAPIISDKGLAQLDKWELEKSEMGKVIKSVPATFSSIYFSESDYPLSYIEDQATKSKKFWAGPKAAQNAAYFQSHNFDWQTFQELNAQADQVWIAMKACNQTDLHRLRKNYFLGAPCDSKAANDQVVAQIRELATNFFQFIDTMPLIYEAGVQDGINFRTTTMEIPYQHPMLYQIALQTWSFVLNLGNEKMREDMIYLDLAMYELQENTVPNPHMKNLYAQMGGQPQRYSDTYKNWAKLNINLTKIISGQNARCEALGLWPAANRAQIFTTDFSYNLQSPDLKKIALHGEEKFKQACGVEMRASKAIPGTYNGYALAHILETRRLFATYYPTEKTKGFLDMVRKSNKLAPYEKVACE